MSSGRVPSGIGAVVRAVAQQDRAAAVDDAALDQAVAVCGVGDVDTEEGHLADIAAAGLRRLLEHDRDGDLH